MSGRSIECRLMNLSLRMSEREHLGISTDQCSRQAFAPNQKLDVETSIGSYGLHTYSFQHPHLRRHPTPVTMSEPFQRVPSDKDAIFKYGGLITVLGSFRFAFHGSVINYEGLCLLLLVLEDPSSPPLPPSTTPLTPHVRPTS